jgi:hypothetical protein
MENTAIINFLKGNPGAIAEEIGATSVEMNRAFKAGLVIKLGTRSMNRRGRPPVEWAVPGTEGVVQDARVSEALAHARQRVDDHREYERDYARLSHVRLTFGLGSAEHVEARLSHKEKWPVPPVMPAQSDYAVMGAVLDLEGIEEAA